MFLPAHKIATILVMVAFSGLSHAQFKVVCPQELDRLVSHASQRPAGSYTDSRIPKADKEWLDAEFQAYEGAANKVKKMSRAELQEAVRNTEADLRNIERGVVPLPDAFSKKRASLSMEAWVCFYKAQLR